MPAASPARLAVAVQRQPSAETGGEDPQRGVFDPARVVSIADGASADRHDFRRPDQHCSLATEQYEHRAKPAALDQRPRGGGDFARRFATGSPVACASSRRLGISTSAPR